MYVGTKSILKQCITRVGAKVLKNNLQGSEGKEIQIGWDHNYMIIKDIGKGYTFLYHVNIFKM